MITKRLQNLKTKRVVGIKLRNGVSELFDYLLMQKERYVPKEVCNYDLEVVYAGIG